uniref:Uncharacterized protein n=1 Tax=Zea mays TaxID=4577 RepID=C4J068_MAIZE|nr:unknown [Zea mays]
MSGAAPIRPIWKFTINGWNDLAPQKRLDVSALSDASAILPLLLSILIWVSNQTKNEATPLYSTLQRNKKWSDTVLFAKHAE